MLEVLRNPTFRRLFFAQVVALVGTGLATVALALLAYELAGDKAGAVLGTALAIKMTVYVLLAPVAGAIVPPAMRKTALIALDVVRALVALALPFVDQIWQIYILIALLQSASACFTPLFQSLIPEILTEERDYTRALSLSRLAYDLESLFSPTLAAALLTVISFHGLFAGTSMGFLASALLVMTVAFPAMTTAPTGVGAWTKARKGIRIYLGTPRLRGLLVLNLCAAAGGAMVFVNTVVVVREALGGGDAQVAWALAAFGGGSMAMAMLLPKILEHVSDRAVMLTASISMVVALGASSLLWHLTAGIPPWPDLLMAWAGMGISYSALVTPGGRLLRRSAHAADFPFLFAAQFSLSHLCWLLAYPLAGWVGATLGLGLALVSLTGLAAVACLLAFVLWRRSDEVAPLHAHPELNPDHPHMIEHQDNAGRHRHAYVIDDLHDKWPRP